MDILFFISILGIACSTYALMRLTESMAILKCCIAINEVQLKYFRTISDRELLTPEESNFNAMLNAEITKLSQDANVASWFVHPIRLIKAKFHGWYPIPKADGEVVFDVSEGSGAAGIVSDCCGARVVTHGSDEGTHYYDCTQCLSACDPK